MPLIIALSCAISCCSCSSCGRRISGAFFGFCGFGTGFSCLRASVSGAGSCFGCSSTLGAGSCGTAAGCCSASGRRGSAGSGSAVGFSTSSRSASSSGCASEFSSTSPVGISKGRSSVCSASRTALFRPKKPNRFFVFPSVWPLPRSVISSGRSTAVVEKKARNRSSRSAISSGVISRRSLVFFGILVPPVVIVGVPDRSRQACWAPRCDWISYRIMPAATDTL